MICENCGISHNGSYGSGRFCSQKCSRGFSTKFKRGEINYKVSKTLKNKYPKLIKKCISCNSINISKRSKYCNECKKFLQYSNMFDKLNIDKNISIKDKNKMAFKILQHEYQDNNMSCMDILRKYGIRQNTLTYYFKLNNTSLRSIGEAISLDFELRKRDIPLSPRYITTDHITWDNKKVILRSSNELTEALKLDEAKESYEVETLRIKYFDTVKNRKRIAIPDFYLPNTNTIVEVKCTYTYDKRNMDDKIKAYKENGYNFKLILDNKEVINI